MTDQIPLSARPAASARTFRRIASALLFLAAAFALTTGCGKKNESPTPEPTQAPRRIQVLVTSGPAEYLAKSIAANAVDIIRLSDSDAGFQSGLRPVDNPTLLKRIQDADIILLTGFDWEADVLPKDAKTPRRQTRVQLHQGLDDLSKVKIQVISGLKEKTDLASSNVYNAPLDFWLNPMLLKTRADSVLSALSAACPSERAGFQSRHSELTAALLTLNSRIGQKLKPYAHKPFYVSKPGFRCFAAHFRLSQIVVDIDRVASDETRFKSIVDMMKQTNARAFFVPGLTAPGKEFIAYSVLTDTPLTLIPPYPADPLAVIETLAEKLEVDLMGRKTLKTPAGPLPEATTGASKTNATTGATKAKH